MVNILLPSIKNPLDQTPYYKRSCGILIGDFLRMSLVGRKEVAVAYPKKQKKPKDLLFWAPNLPEAMEPRRVRREVKCKEGLL